jgi:hypothetical protein
LRESILRARPWAAPDPEDAQAISQQGTPEIENFKASSEAFNARVHQELKGIPVPTALRDQILARGKIIRPTFWNRTRVRLAAAAAFVILAGGGLLVLSPWQRSFENMGFAGFRSRMVGFALREYRMDILTTDAQTLKRFLAARGTPADFNLPPSLSAAPLKGGACLTWQGKPVSMVCFDSPEHSTLYLFVVADPEKNLTTARPSEEIFKKLPSVSWNAEGETFLLVGKIPESILKPLLEAKS